MITITETTRHGEYHSIVSVSSATASVGEVLRMVLAASPYYASPPETTYKDIWNGLVSQNAADYGWATYTLTTN